MKHIAYLVIALSLVACSKSEPPRAAVAEPVVAKPTEPAVAQAAPTPSPTALPTANTLAIDEGEVVHWDVGGRRLEATMSRSDPTIRITGGGATFDFQSTGSDKIELEIVDGALVYRSSPSSEEPLDTHVAIRFAWANDKVVIEKQWKCDRTKRSVRCKLPAWAEASLVPTEQTAVQLTRDWLTELSEVTPRRDLGSWLGDYVVLSVADCPSGATPRVQALTCAQKTIAWLSAVIAKATPTSSISSDGEERVVRWAVPAGEVKALDTPLVVELTVGLEIGEPVIRAMRVKTS